MGRGRLKAKLKRHAAEYEPDQHGRQRDGQGIDNHRVGQRKRAEQPCAAENQPGFISVPDRCDAVHHHVAFFGIAHKAEQHADTEIETVHDDVHQRGEDNNGKPDDRDIDAHQIFSSSGTDSAADSGRAGVPDVLDVSVPTGCGPFFINRAR